MFKFDKTKFQLRSLKLKAISKSTIDPRVTFIDEHDQTIKMSIPASIARRMRIALKNVTTFTTFYPCAIAFVDGRVVAMEVPDGKEYATWRQTGRWEPKLKAHSQFIDDLSGDWFYDGQYVYRPTEAVKHMEGTNFGSLKVDEYNLYNLDRNNNMNDMACLCYRNPTTLEWTVTSPVTRSSGDLLQLTGDVDEFNAADRFGSTSTDLFLMDLNVYPNLRFVNYAARALSDQFGFESIEPLGLPLLMIEHRTFNIGGLPIPVQTSSAAPFKFTHALAWLVGMFGQVQTLDQLIAVKSSIKMLLSKGHTRHTTEGTKNDDEVDTKTLIQRVRRTFESAALVSFAN